MKKLKKFAKQSLFSEENLLTEKNFYLYNLTFKKFFFFYVEALFLRSELENPVLDSGLQNFSFKGKNEILFLAEKKTNNLLIDCEVFSEIWDLYGFSCDENFITKNIIEKQNIAKKQNSNFPILFESENKRVREENADFLLLFYNNQLQTLLKSIAEREAFYSFYLQLSNLCALKRNIAKLIFSTDCSNFDYFIELLEFRGNYKKMLEID